MDYICLPQTRSLRGSEGGSVLHKDQERFFLICNLYSSYYIQIFVLTTEGLICYITSNLIPLF